MFRLNVDFSTCYFVTGGHSLLEEQLIPASYLAVKNAVNNITIECYFTNRTPVLDAEEFR